MVRLWDSFFAAEDPAEFLLQFCCAMLMHCRHELLTEGFGDNIKLLQTFPTVTAAGPTDMNVLLGNTVELIAKYRAVKAQEAQEKRGKASQGGQGTQPLASSLSNAKEAMMARARTWMGWG